MPLYACVLALSMMVSSMGICQQNVSKLQSVHGIVSTVDSVGSILVLQVNNQNEMVRFTVDKEAKIQRGSDDIFLDDILQGDPVTLRYYEFPDGTLMVTSIIDSNLANDF